MPRSQPAPLTYRPTEAEGIVLLRHILTAAQRCRGRTLDRQHPGKLESELTGIELAFLAMLDKWLFDPRYCVLLPLQRAVEQAEATGTLPIGDFLNWATIATKFSPAIGIVAQLPFTAPDPAWAGGWAPPTHEGDPRS